MKRMYSEQELIKATVEAIKSLDISVGSLKVDGNAVINGEVSGDVIGAVYDGSIESNVTETLGLTVVSSFVKAVRNFNELQFIFNCRLKNETGDSVTIGTDTPLCRFRDVPDEIKNKIYMHDGNPVGSNGIGAIAATTLYLNDTGGTAKTYNPRYISLYAYSGLLMFYNEGGAFSLADDETVDLEARISLAL